MVVFYLEREFVQEECGHEPAEGALLRLAPLVQQDYGSAVSATISGSYATGGVPCPSR